MPTPFLFKHYFLQNILSHLLMSIFSYLAVNYSNILSYFLYKLCIIVGIVSSPAAETLKVLLIGFLKCSISVLFTFFIIAFYNIKTVNVLNKVVNQLSPDLVVPLHLNVENIFNLSLNLCSNIKSCITLYIPSFTYYYYLCGIYKCYIIGIKNKSRNY